VSHLVLFPDADQFALSRDLYERAKRNGFDLLLVDGHEITSMRQEGRDCVGVVLTFATVDAPLLDDCPRWRILARAGTGYDRIDADAAASRGIMVTNVPDFSSDELSNQTMLFVLAFARQLPFLLQAFEARRWPGVPEFPPTERLSEQTLGIVGFGPSGQAVAAKAAAFGLRLFTWSRTPRPEVAARLGVTECTFEEVLNCDYVSIHLALTSSTMHVINRDTLRMFRRGSVLINTARGGLVETAALIAALDAGVLRGAGLDVFEPEPPSEQHPIWQRRDVLLTMHTGANSRAAHRTAFESAFDEIGRHLRQEPPLHPVAEMAYFVASAR
jgi:phosphoglycerate dehydrogenase-like enzyme